MLRAAALPLLGTAIILPRLALATVPSAWGAAVAAAEERRKLLLPSAEAVAKELSEAAATSTPPIIVDCGSADVYDKVRLPGARWLGGPAALRSATDGRGGIPLEEDVSALVARLALPLTGSPRIVVYDEGPSIIAARASWLLRMYGFTNVALLDGGLQHWLQEDLPVETGEPSATDAQANNAASVTPVHVQHAARSVGDSDVVAAGREGRLVDVRTAEELAGIDPRGNPRQGRIPGASHLDHRLLYRDGSTTLMSTLELMQLYAEQAGLGLPDAWKEAGRPPVVTYCQAGVRAALAVTVLDVLGYPAAMYDVGMSAYSRESALPLE